MFGRKKENQVLSDNDAQQLLVSIDNIIAGDFSDVSVSSFNDPVIGDKLNAMLLSIKQVNTPVVMRLNETMEVIGDNGLMKDTFEQVESQTKSIKSMETAGLHLENSIDNISEAIGHIRDNTHDVLSVSQNVTVYMLLPNHPSVSKLLISVFRTLKERLVRSKRLLTLLKRFPTRVIFLHSMHLLRLHELVKLVRALPLLLTRCVCYLVILLNPLRI